MTSFAEASYLLLSTRKRDGQWVDTPVWFAPGHDEFYCYSSSKAGKVKRLRNFTDVRIAPCTVTGTPLGPYQFTSARILETPEAITLAKQALHRRYGWQARLLDILAFCAGRHRQRTYIAITYPR